MLVFVFQKSHICWNMNNLFYCFNLFSSRSGEVCYNECLGKSITYQSNRLNNFNLAIKISQMIPVFSECYLKFETCITYLVIVVNLTGVNQYLGYCYLIEFLVDGIFSYILV